MDEWISEKIRLKYPKTNNQTVLDLGCGDGLNSIGLAKLGFEVTALDKLASTVEAVQKHAQEEGINLSLIVSNIMDYQDNSRQYDIVLFTHVLHFLSDEDQLSAIKKVISLVKTGGVLIFADIEDDYPVDQECLFTLKHSLKDVTIERLSIEDKPHRGANYDHEHKVIYMIGEKK